MKSFRKYLKEDADKDHAFVEEADHVWKKLITDLHINKLKNYFWNKEKTNFGINIGTVTGSKLYDSLFVAFFAKDKSQTGGFAKTKSAGYETITLYALSDEDLKEKNPVYSALEKNYQAIASSFTHEFIHYLDSSRISDDRWENIVTGMINKNVHSGDLRVYYNQPLEFNAFTQEGFAKAESFISSLFKKLLDKPNELQSLVTGKLAALFSDDFNDVWNFSIDSGIFSTNFINNLTDQNRKRLMSRYYSLYKQVIKPKLLKLRGYLSIERKRQSTTNSRHS